MSFEPTAHSVCSPDPVQGGELGRGGCADAGVSQGALDAVRCRVLSSSTALGKSLTLGFDTGGPDMSARVMFSALFVQFSCGESRETLRARN